jgi:hypothetical protein
MKAHEKCNILAHSKFMETHFGPNEPAAFCAQLKEAAGRAQGSWSTYINREENIRRKFPPRRESCNKYRLIVARGC